MYFLQKTAEKLAPKVDHFQLFFQLPHSAMWQGVKDHLGWESTGTPTRLETVEEEKDKKVKRVLVSPEEIGEAITRAFEDKGERVMKAIGEPKGNYMSEVTRLHKGNVGKFSIGETVQKDVKKRLRKVDNKTQLW